MQNRALRVGPVALSTTLTVTVLNCSLSALAGPTGYTQTQPYVILTHVRIVNKQATAGTVSLYIGSSGADAAGTEFAFNAYSVAGNSYVDWYGRVRLESTDYLTGGASAATTLTFQAEGEIGLT